MKILVTGTTGESMPPPYGGVPKLVLFYARIWKEKGHQTAATFTYCPLNPDDLGAKAQYFYEYKSRPSNLDKILYLLKHFLSNPFLYIRLFMDYYKITQRVTKELVLFSAYGVFIDKVCASFKPDIIFTEAVLIKSFMVAANYRK